MRKDRLEKDCLWVCLISTWIFIALLMSGVFKFNYLKANYIRVVGGENHCSGETIKEVYENCIMSDVVVGDVSSPSSGYFFYMGCDGTFWHRGLVEHVRPMTDEENRELSQRYVRNYDEIDRPVIQSGFVWGEQRWRYTLDNKLVAYIDKDGVHGLSEQEKKKIKKEILKEVKELYE